MLCHGVARERLGERERESVPCARACKAACSSSSRASALSTRPVHRCTSRDSCTAHPTTDTHTTARPESGPDLPAFPGRDQDNRCRPTGDRFYRRREWRLQRLLMPSAVKTRPAMISDFKSSVHILNPLHMYNVHAVTVQAFQEIKTFTVQAFQEIKSLKRFRGATRNGEYYHDMMACDGSSKPDSEFVQVQVARCHKISSLESPKIFSCGLRLYGPWKTLSGC